MKFLIEHAYAVAVLCGLVVTLVVGRVLWPTNRRKCVVSLVIQGSRIEGWTWRLYRDGLLVATGNQVYRTRRGLKTSVRAWARAIDAADVEVVEP